MAGNNDPPDFDGHDDSGINRRDHAAHEGSSRSMDPTAAEDGHRFTGAARHRAKTFECPNCGGSVAIRNPGQSMSAVCSQCNSIIDTTNNNYKILSQFYAKTETFSPIIELGSRGELMGKRWEVIGFMVRKDRASNFHWQEYLLFNPAYGYRWLVESNGHWNFVTTIKKKPRRIGGVFAQPCYGDVAELDGVKYKLFEMGTAAVIYVLGEFYWRVAVEQTVQTQDYICPPKMLSCEIDTNEIVWSIGEYIEPATIQKSFSLKNRLPHRIGIGANQPSPLREPWPKLLRLWMVFIVVLTCLQGMHLIFSSNKSILTTQCQCVANGKIDDITSPVFNIQEGNGNLAIDIDTDLDNSWLYVSGDLVSERTGEPRNFEKSLGHYHGYEGGEYWSEGSSSGRVLFSNIPAGQYYLNLDAESGDIRDTSQNPQFGIKIIRNVPTYSNYFLCLALVSILPLTIWFRIRSHEVARWSNSDYSPYSSS